MRLGIPIERAEGERRVSVTPDVISDLGEAGWTVVVESQAGERSGFTDDMYAERGATIGNPWDTDVVAIVTTVPDPSTLRPGIVVVGFLDPWRNDGRAASWAQAGITALAMEAMPRTTLAQTTDALSSQATAAGYAATLLAATEAPRFFPMLVTAAGTVAPAKVLVLGVGVAGLQAIATAKRLGAVVSAYDIRPETREQVESLGARFVDSGEVRQEEHAGGYARALSDERVAAQQEALAAAVAMADIVITTAQVPGRQAPVLINRAAVESMRAGSVIVDMAASSGGNCEVTIADQVVDIGGVHVLGPTDLASRVAADASRMYARNVRNLIGRLVHDGRVMVDLEDEIIGGCSITHGGAIVHPQTPGYVAPADEGQPDA